MWLIIEESLQSIGYRYIKTIKIEQGTLPLRFTNTANTNLLLIKLDTKIYDHCPITELKTQALGKVHTFLTFKNTIITIIIENI